MKTYIQRQPAFYGKFQCVGGSCPDSCCANWGAIPWSDREYEKLMSAKISDELHEKLSSAFVRFKNPITGVEQWNY